MAEFVIELHKIEVWRSIPIITLTAKDLASEDHLCLNRYIETILQKKAYILEKLELEICQLLLMNIGSEYI